MSTEIYYFTGTGNSLVLARSIVEKTNGKLISIPSVMDKQSIYIDADTVGIVFPCYLSQLYGIPLIVERFIRKLVNINSIEYLFAVCSFGGYSLVNGLPVLKNLSRLVKALDGKLSG